MMPFQTSSVSASTVATNCVISSLRVSLIWLPGPEGCPVRTVPGSVAEHLQRIDAHELEHEIDHADDQDGLEAQPRAADPAARQPDAAAPEGIAATR
jgi:hypothetical protein